MADSTRKKKDDDATVGADVVDEMLAIPRQAAAELMDEEGEKALVLSRLQEQPCAEDIECVTTVLCAALLKPLADASTALLKGVMAGGLRVDKPTTCHAIALYQARAEASAPGLFDTMMEQATAVLTQLLPTIIQHLNALARLSRRIKGTSTDPSDVDDGDVIHASICQRALALAATEASTNLIICFTKDLRARVHADIELLSEESVLRALDAPSVAAAVRQLTGYTNFRSLVDLATAIQVVLGRLSQSGLDEGSPGQLPPYPVRKAAEVALVAMTQLGLVAAPSPKAAVLATPLALPALSIQGRYTT